MALTESGVLVVGGVTTAEGVLVALRLTDDGEIVFIRFQIVENDDYWGGGYWAGGYWGGGYWSKYGALVPVTLKMALKGVLSEKNAWIGKMSERIWTDDFDPEDFEEADFDMGGGGWNAIIEEKESWKGELKEIEE